MQLTEFIKDQIWTRDYPVKLPLCPINARMSVVRLPDGQLMLHSPGDINDATVAAISKLGKVGYIVAPGSLHHLHVAEAQSRFPDAQTYICPGIEHKVPRLRFDWILSPHSPAAWSDTIDHVLIRGNRFVCEVAMLHKPSRTLLLVDLIEYFTDQTENVSWQLKAWWKLALRMWNKPKPAPEYQMGWKDKVAAKACLEAILEWDFDKIILSHGDNITENAKQKARYAWASVLKK